MNKQEILSKVDHTLLKAAATWPEIQALCEEAIAANTATVCVPPCYVQRIRAAFGQALKICVVIGFPLGYSVTAAKVAEATAAIADGADEVDMVINITDLKNGDYGKVEQEIAAVKQAVGNHILKVIIETCYLNEAEKIAMCKAVTAAGADYIKTSTGFGSAGATLEDVRLFKAHVGKGVKIKAAGGMKSLADIQAFVEEGVDRLGTSSALRLLNEQQAADY